MIFIGHFGAAWNRSMSRAHDISMNYIIGLGQMFKEKKHTYFANLFTTNYLPKQKLFRQ